MGSPGHCTYTTYIYYSYLSIQVHVYEQERLERKCLEFQQELERQKAYYERNFFPADEIEEFKKALETKVYKFVAVNQSYRNDHNHAFYPLELL